MDIKELLNGVDCSCGRHHSCNIDFIAIERGAIGHLTARDGKGSLAMTLA